MAKQKKKKKPAVKKATTRESAVIAALIRAKNGPTNCWKWLRASLEQPDFTRQNIVNWRERGYVPLEMVKDVADAFAISPYLLNYEGYMKVTGEDPGSWNELVADSGLFKND